MGARWQLVTLSVLLFTAWLVVYESSSNAALNAYLKPALVVLALACLLAAFVVERVRRSYWRLLAIGKVRVDRTPANNPACFAEIRIAGMEGAIKAEAELEAPDGRVARIEPYPHHGHPEMLINVPTSFASHPPRIAGWYRLTWKAQRAHERAYQVAGSTKVWLVEEPPARWLFIRRMLRRTLGRERRVE